MKINGILKTISDTVQVSNDFQRRNIVLEHCDKGHIELVSFELYQDHCKLVDTFKEGDKVIVDFNVKGRKWTNMEGTTKYFNTLQAWKIVYDTSDD